MNFPYMFNRNTMLDMNRNTVLAIAGVCGTAFIGYCIYFDRKRRSAPDFKQKLKESMIAFYEKYLDKKAEEQQENVFISWHDLL